jgi:RNA polymerase-binding protein DksA
MPEIQKIKESLLARLEELEKRADDIEDDLREPQEDDTAERATESAGDEVAGGIGEMAENEINKIKSALAKIKAGTYGVCVSCEEDINLKRLAAVPHATKCVKCA